jgi:hypothetical protein
MKVGHRLKGRPIDEPKGPKRADAMARATDDLAQQAEERSEERGAIDPKKLVIESEIAQHFNSLEVSHAQPGYVYCWARFKGDAGGVTQVQMKLAMTVKTNQGILPCWEVVCGNMPEAIERKATGPGMDTTRCLGDVMLLRCRMEVYEAIRAYEERKAERQRTGAMEGMQDKAREHRMIVHTDPNDPVLQRAMKHAEAHETANRMLDNQIREGRVPGVAAPGQR